MKIKDAFEDEIEALVAVEPPHPEPDTPLTEQELEDFLNVNGF